MLGHCQCCGVLVNILAAHFSHLRSRLQADVFAGEYGAKRLADLKLRVIEHNVLVVSKYYTRISTARLAELLDLTPLEVSEQGGGGGGTSGELAALYRRGWRADCGFALAVPCHAQHYLLDAAVFGLPWLHH